MWQGWTKCSPGGAGRRLYAPPVHPYHLQRIRTDYTAQEATQAVPDARKTAHNRPRTDTHARTLDALHRSTPDTRQTIVSAAGLDCQRSVSGKVYNFGRLFLSIFIWIYFDESIDNPHIYGYNIISPDKYGLQPH